MTVSNSKNSNGIQVIERAAAILRVLAETGEGLSLGQIAHRVQLPRSTVQRIVGALSAEGFAVMETRGDGFRLGPELQALAKASGRSTRDVMGGAMRKIAQETGETVDLAVLDGQRMLFVDQVVGTQRLRTVSSIGERFPLSTTANGKAALACLSEAEAARLVIGEMEHLGTTHRSLPALLEEVDGIRAGALATDEDEHTEGVSALGFAMRGEAGDVFAVSIPVPSTRYARLKDSLSKTLRQNRDRLAAHVAR